MAVLKVGLRSRGTTNFSNGDLYYPVTDYNYLVNRPSTFPPTAHNHNASDVNAGTLHADRIPTLAQSKITNLVSDLSGKALASHKYHSFSNGQYFFDTYEQGNYFRLFTEIATFDQFRFQPISNVEYFDGTNWVSWSGGDSNIKLLLDGREETGFSLDHTHRRFRFTVQRSGAWPTMALLVLHETWTALNHPDTTIKIETWNGSSWVLKDTTVFGSGTTGNTLGMHVKATNTVHDGIANTRVTVEMNDWTDNGIYTTIPLRRLMFLSNFNGGVIHPWSWNYDKVVTFGATPKVGSNNVILEGDSRLTNARPASDVYAWAKAATKPSYTWSEIGSKPTTFAPIIGSGAADAVAGNDSRLTNARPASDVYAWAKAATKPSYTASEVGALGATAKAADSSLLNGTVESEAATVSTIVKRTAQNYIYAGYINSNRGNEATAAASYIYDSGDGWLRKKTLANAQTEIVTKAAVEAVLTGNITTHDHGGVYAYSGHEHSWAHIISGKPTTLSGYGITDAVELSKITTHAQANPINPANTTIHAYGYCNSISLFGQTDGGLISHAFSSSWQGQIYQDYRTGQLAIRGKNNGTWQAWRIVRDSVNFVSGTDFAPAHSHPYLADTHAASGVTSQKITNWDAAFSWGNHAGLYRPVAWVPSLHDLSNVNISINPSDGNFLVWNATSEKWIASSSLGSSTNQLGKIYAQDIYMDYGHIGDIFSPLGHTHNFTVSSSLGERTSVGTSTISAIANYNMFRVDFTLEWGDGQLGHTAIITKNGVRCSLPIWDSHIGHMCYLHVYVSGTSFVVGSGTGTGSFTWADVTGSSKILNVKLYGITS